MGGGAGSGRGGGEIAEKTADEFVHEGSRALCLEVWREDGGSGTAWAAASTLLACRAHARLRVGTWLYVSSRTKTVRSERTTAQLRVEFFSDREGREPASGRTFFSQPIPLHQPEGRDQWRALEIGGLIPMSARSMRVSIVLIAEDPQPEREGVWFDDAFVCVLPEECPSPGSR